MHKDVIAVFDIGKTNKKFLLFDTRLKVVHEEEVKFNETTDDDGFHCEDIDYLEKWMQGCITSALSSESYNIKAVNFATYGASVMYLDEHGKRLTPLYNYLKPMPEGILDGFYDYYGGLEEFSRKTASPALGMLNSGLQALWLKRAKPEVFSKVKSILHFPQYLSYTFSHHLTSEYTSIGCHTAMWDFDQHKYHKWLTDEGIKLPEPVSNSTTFKTDVQGRTVDLGIGIHDSSSSLVPYLKGLDKKFILISTGTWCIFMNPFNDEPLTAEQLRHDSLCYMSIRQQQVKSSRLFLGHIHDVNIERLSKHFRKEKEYYKRIITNHDIIISLIKDKPERLFYRDGVPAGYVDETIDLAIFNSFDEAYHRFMFDLVDVAMESLVLILPSDDQTKAVYISGGFARNEIFTTLLASRLPEKEVFTSEVDNATALGAAMVVWESAFGNHLPPVNMGLKKVKNGIST